MQDVLKNKLERINNDEVMLTALRTVLEARILAEKPEVGKTDDNYLLGQKYRSDEKAKDILLGYFIDIDSYKKGNKNAKSFNKER